MPILDERGYLETPYLSRRYHSGEIDLGTGMQVDMKTIDNIVNGMQVDLRASDLSSIGMEVKIGKLKIVLCGGYLTTPYLTTPYLMAEACGLQGMQVDMLNADAIAETGTQVEMKIQPLVATGMQALMQVFKDNLTGMQTDMFIVSPDDDAFTGMQVDQKIFNQVFTGMQTELRVFTDKRTGMQTTMIKALPTGMQATMSIYNITQFRFLCSFSSRGTIALGGNNWTSPQGVEAGDFLLRNLNTDVVEERTQSPAGILALWELRCDTGAGNTFVDTIAILNHNLTTSALVQVQGSDDAGFGAVKFSFNMTVELKNMYYVAPLLPTIPARYYRFTIQDPTNPDADTSLKIGTIVFGSSVIISRRTCYQNPVTFGLKHFKDTLKTEGYTSVSNDRALRRILRLDFTEVLFDGGDYAQFQAYFKTAKTDLKCLIIPRPTRPSSLAVFSKLTQLPEEQHNAIEDNAWYVDLTLDYDESD